MDILVIWSCHEGCCSGHPHRCLFIHVCMPFLLGIYPRVMFCFIRSCQFSIFTPFTYIYLSSHISLLMQVCYPLWPDKKTRALSVPRGHRASEWQSQGTNLDLSGSTVCVLHHMVSCVVPLQYYLSINPLLTQPGGVNRAALCFPGTF